MSSGNLDSGTTAEELEAAFAPKKAPAPKPAPKPAAPKAPKTVTTPQADA